MSVTPHPTRSKKEPGKHWYIILGRDKDRVTIPYSGTYEEAVAIERSMRQKTQGTVPTVPKISELILPFYRYYEGESAASTVRDMKWVMEGHLIHFFGTMQPKQITPEVIDQYKQLCRRRQLSKRSINKHMSYLSSMIKWAVKRKYCHPLPFKIEMYPAKQVRAAAKEIVPLKAEQFDALVEVIEDKYRLLVLLMGEMGLRRNEALHLRANNVDTENSNITIMGKGSKKRTIPWTSDRVEAEILNAIEKRPRGFLTVNPATNKPYYSIRKALLRAANKAQLGREVDHHVLRHTFLTLWAEKSISPYALQKMAGHKDIQTTMAIYAKVGQDFVADEVKKIRDK